MKRRSPHNFSFIIKKQTPGVIFPDPDLRYDSTLLRRSRAIWSVELKGMFVLFFWKLTLSLFNEEWQAGSIDSVAPWLTGLETLGLRCLLLVNEPPWGNPADQICINDLNSEGDQTSFGRFARHEASRLKNRTTVHFPKIRHFLFSHHFVNNSAPYPRRAVYASTDAQSIMANE